jgi:hypothetical protein
MRRLRVLIWHVHGSYLYYLSQCPHDFYVPSRPDRGADFAGRCGHFPWGDNVVDVPAEEVRRLDLDCIIYQLPRQYEQDRFALLSDSQRRLPYIYLQHDPPFGHPTDSRHVVDDPGGMVVHVTPFNALMWDCGRARTRVIDHGVLVPAEVRYTGAKARGLVVVNHLRRRGRRLGADVYDRVRAAVPLDLVGMGAAAWEGGLGEVRHDLLPAFQAEYRFFFNPIRYTSLGLAVCEAMMLGMPIVALATTEMASAVQHGVSGYVDTDVAKLIPAMRRLLRDPEEARRLGEGARRYAMERFAIHRFVRDWNAALRDVTGLGAPARAAVGAGEKYGQAHRDDQ